ncbi:NAD(P)/FAD-dependent oxidoreductase [Yoonia sp. GPGPB17]|uniref:NAD(P)/FAD-dependent oxidoreductase n=1 Tax=Yoonia sp. GPGPB17 TaxID=3026147 RepID=UPI0030C50A01
MSDSYDIAVIGAGPAGANAAMTAARAGASVAVVDEQPKPGGQVWRAKSAAIVKAPATPETVLGDALRSDLAASDVTHLGDARVWQIERDSNGWVVYTLSLGKTIQIKAKALILATGAREYVQPIPGWTTPGVFGLAGATALFKQDLTLPGTNTVVSGTGPLVFFVASEIRRLGGQVAAIVTSNTRTDWARALPAMLQRPDLLWRGAVWVADLMLARVPIYWGHAATGVQGGPAVNVVTFQKLDKTGAPIGLTKKISADSLCLGNGLIPAIEAAQLAGASIEHRPELGGWVPKTQVDGTTDVPGLYVCGDGAGIRGAAAAEIQGELVGHAASVYVGKMSSSAPPGLKKAYARAARFGLAMTALNMPKPGYQVLTTPETILCRCESLTQATIVTEVASGAQSANAVKSGLRAGMGPCGGQFCQTAIARLIAQLDDGAEADVPLPIARPPLRPVPMAEIAGDFNYGDLPIPKPAPL